MSQRRGPWGEAECQPQGPEHPGPPAFISEAGAVSLVANLCVAITPPSPGILTTADAPRITESQKHRMVGVGRDLCGSPSPIPCPSRVTQSRLHRTVARRGWNISREGDSTTSLWAAWARAPSPSEGRSSSSGSAGTSQASVCARCPLPCRWAPLQRVWPHPPDPHPADI